MPPAIAWFAGVGVACGGRCRTDEPVPTESCRAEVSVGCGGVNRRHTARTKPPIHGTFDPTRALTRRRMIRVSRETCSVCS